MFSRNLPVHTGQDPRPWREYTQLREELSKLTHPARPDVDWQKVEQLCAALFRHNGADLQTTAWFCCARLQRNGLEGLQEGLELLDSLISHQWSVMWPPAGAVRREILVWLSDHLILSLRRFTLSHQDLPVVYRLEQQCRHLCDMLQRLELRQASKMDVLLHWMHAAVVRLENARESRLPASAPAYETPPENTVQQTVAGEPVVMVFRDDGTLSPGRPSIRSHYRRAVWSGVVGGMTATLLLMVAGVSGWQSWQKHRPENVLARSLSPLPSALSVAEQDALINSHAAELQSQGGEYHSLIRSQLDTLAAQPPGSKLDYGFELVAQAQRLWPHHPDTDALSRYWQHQVEAAALPTDQLQSWHQVMQQLQSLTTKLNSTDVRRGKYLTVSELKSEVFAITQALSRNPPLEEQLRQLSQAQAGTPARRQAELKAEQYLHQLINRHVLVVRASEGKSGR